MEEAKTIDTEALLKEAVALLRRSARVPIYAMGANANGQKGIIRFDTWESSRDSFLARINS